MELHFEVIRDKEAIYAELLQGQSLGYQLAICYNSDGKLIVKICIVTNIAMGIDGIVITLRGHPNDAATEVKVALNSIESIYPIHPFLK
jgi:hypothetical protein